jgi:hypothetical protein
LVVEDLLAENLRTGPAANDDPNLFFPRFDYRIAMIGSSASNRPVWFGADVSSPVLLLLIYVRESIRTF